MCGQFDREKYETLVEKSNQGLDIRREGDPDGGYSQSTDSAIDSDLSEWHTESLPIDLVSTNTKKTCLF